MQKGSSNNKRSGPNVPWRKSLFGKQTLADAGYRPTVIGPTQGVRIYVSALGSYFVLLGRTSRLLFTARTDTGDTLRLTHRYANGSLLFVTVAMSFVGMIMVYQSTAQLSRAIGDTQLVGAAFLKLLVRVLGPTVIGMLIACRVGAGIAAEVGAMAVTEQLDALKLCAAPPIEVLIVPRLRAGILASLVLVLIGSAAAAFAGRVTASVLFGMSPGTYWNFELLRTADVVQGMGKAAVYGIAIPIVAGACGLKAIGGARGVGQATTNAVVGSSLAIVILDSLISLACHAVIGQ